MNGNRSVATIAAPEFINLSEDAINPGISECEVKVFYIGKNRNGSFIDKNTAIQMANSLPGTPIVGAFRKDVEDFGDHGDVLHLEDGELTFLCKTVPYGFVAPDARCFFKTFLETDSEGNSIEREYLMTTGYLWTGQYPELKDVIISGKGQSMELDPETLSGEWAKSNNSEIEFFIINDAVFTKLCILGDDVEPCFEGASVTAPDISKQFTFKQDFSNTLFSMMKELQHAMNVDTNYIEGGSHMLRKGTDGLNNDDDVVIELEVDANGAEDDQGETSTSATLGQESDPVSIELDDVAEVSADEQTENSDVSDNTADTADESSTEESSDSDGDNNDAGSEFAANQEEPTELELEFAKLQEEYNSMKAELESLRTYKLEQENAQKDEIINKYYMLDDADKADVIAHKSELTCQEIEEKLAFAYVQKNVDFSSIDGSPEEVDTVILEEEDPITTFSLDDNAGYVPPIVDALRQVNTR